ncbi:MAG: peptide chain release factor 1 [Pseudonocardiales bacterium]|nr:peptide chain release factor 1 [Pseudonocardiales bacterium]
MQIQDAVKRVYSRPGPFATVYQDATRSSEHGSHEVELRWQERRAELTHAGADEATLSAMDEVILNHYGVPGPHGQVVVASGGAVLLDRQLRRPPVRPIAAWAPLPHLMPYFAQLGPQTPHVVVVANRTGADIHTVPAVPTAEGLPSGKTETVEGSRQYPIHKTSVRDWSERHFQQRVENSWAENARDVATAVRKHVADIAAELVVLAGDPRARALIADDLADLVSPRVQIVQIREGARAAGAKPQTLDEAVHDQLLRMLWRERHELLSHLRENLGRHEYAVAGVAAVVEALRKSQADTVVVSDNPASTLKAWIGPEPLELGMSAEELHEMGVPDPQHDRLDAALVRAVAGSEAKLAVTPNAHNYLPEGIGALLRYMDASTPRP